MSHKSVTTEVSASVDEILVRASVLRTAFRHPFTTEASIARCILAAAEMSQLANKLHHTLERVYDAT